MDHAPECNQGNWLEIVTNSWCGPYFVVLFCVLVCDIYTFHFKICSAGDILDYKDPVRVAACIRGLLNTVN